jgi:hypothetical protein
VDNAHDISECTLQIFLTNVVWNEILLRYVQFLYITIVWGKMVVTNTVQDSNRVNFCSFRVPARECQTSYSNFRGSEHIFNNLWFYRWGSGSSKPCSGKVIKMEMNYHLIVPKANKCICTGWNLARSSSDPKHPSQKGGMWEDLVEWLCAQTAGEKRAHMSWHEVWGFHDGEDSSRGLLGSDTV